MVIRGFTTNLLKLFLKLTITNIKHIFTSIYSTDAYKLGLYVTKIDYY